ncbi:MAG: methyltransferase domain-containing protein [Actinomycetes bacterium]
MSAEGYLLDNRATDAEDRFAALSVLFDPVTFRHIDALGIEPGWHCWEVGAGGPSLPDGLGVRVGPGGRVLATDLDTRWLAGRAGPQVEVARHDVVHDEPPGDGFDLVHARLVLLHVPEREEALRRMVSALRPGGWLLVEDYDVNLQPLICPDEVTPDQRLANRVKAEFRQLLLARGADLELGRRLPRMFRDAGLTRVAADAWFPLAMPSVAALERANVRQVREALTARGGVRATDIDRYLDLTATAGFDLATAPLVSTWGQRRQS